MDKINLANIASMIDISAVRTDVTIDEIENIVKAAKQYKFICTFAMPCFTKVLIEKFGEDRDVLVGGVVGFPSGADTTTIKVAAAKELLNMGCDELDMVINVGALKSKRYEIVRDDIRAVVEAAGGTPIKSILEISYLTDCEIAIGAEIAAEEGVAFIKTGTGWGPKPTTVEAIKIIKAAIGDKAKIKAAGGVRTLDDLILMYDAGCSRFGIGLDSAVKIIEEASARMRESEDSLTEAGATEMY